MINVKYYLCSTIIYFLIVCTYKFLKTLLNILLQPFRANHKGSKHQEISSYTFKSSSFLFFSTNTTLKLNLAYFIIYRNTFVKKRRYLSKKGGKTLHISLFVANCMGETFSRHIFYRLNLLKRVSHFIKYSFGTMFALVFWSCCLTPLATSTFQPFGKVILYFFAKFSICGTIACPST